MAHGDEYRSPARRDDALLAPGARLVALLGRLHERAHTPGGFSRAAPYLLVVAALFVTARVAEVFPPAWNDEAHFLALSAPWQTGHTLDPTALLRPEGVYWIPIGYYVFNATLFSLLGHVSLGVARTGSLLCALAGAVALAALYRRLLPEAPRTHAVWFAALWLASPPILLAANVARPEALVVALGLAALVATLRGRRVASSACALLALLVHPLVALPALVSAWLALLLKRRPQITRGELALLFAATALFIAEAARFGAHHAAYVADWVYQLDRKATRELGPLPGLLGLLITLGALAPVIARARCGVAPSATARFLPLVLGTVGLSAVLVQSYGQEMWYASVRFTGVALLLLAASSLRKHAAASWIVLGLLVLIDLGSWARGFDKGRVQGIPLTRSGMREAAREKRELDRLLTTALARPTTDATLISPFLAAPFLEQLQRGELFVVSGLAHVATRRFSRVVYIDRAYPSSLSDHETLEALAGYTCQEAEIVRTEGGRYEVIIARVTPSEGPARGRALRPCTGPTLASHPK